jgi:hypothetical protein
MAEGSKLISRRHPSYNPMASRWDFWLASYRGGDDYINEHLFQYFKEGDEEFKARKARAYRENHCRRLCDIINSYLFKEPAKRKTSNALLTKFFNNADGMGGTLAQFMKTASLFSAVLGRVYLVMDKKILPKDEQTGTQADNLKELPYIYMVYPQDVLDLAYDDDGRLLWALLREQSRDDADPWASSGEIETQYRLWERGKWTLLNDSGMVIDAGDTELDDVPIVALDNENDTPYSGASLIVDVSNLDRAIFNNWSRLDTIVCDQTFSQLIFPIEGLPADIVENDELREQFLTLATNRVVLYSAQAQTPPEFISPDASQVQFVLTMIEKQVKQLYATFGLQGETGEETKAQSGVAKAYDFDKLNKLLASKADNLEKVENKLVELFGQWVNVNGITAEISYPEEFDVKSLADEIAVAQELTLLDISQTFTKEIEKQVVLKALPKAEETTVNAIFKEIDTKVEPDDEAEKKPVFNFDEDGGKSDEE